MEEKTRARDGADQKLRILALHGYRQNAKVFQAKTGSFRKVVHKWAEFTYITAPHRVIPVDSLETLNEIDIGQDPDDVQYGWWFNREDKTFRGVRKGGPAIGFEESLRVVKEAFEKHGPFDGILGFSQGGCFAGLLASLQHRSLLDFKFNFVIIAAGFMSRCLPHLKYYGDTIAIPALIIHGETDDIIPKEMGEELAAAFDDPCVLYHPGKHYLPAGAPQKHPYQHFFKYQLMQKEQQPVELH